VGLLGAALSRHAGMSYEALIAQRILGPLGMSNTGVRLTPETRSRRAIGHDQQGAPVKDWEFSTVFEGAGALRSTMVDMLTFLDANIGVARNDLERAMRVAHSPRAAAGNSSIGLNWLTMKTAGGVEVVYHTGNTGGFSSYLGFDPVRGVGVVMLTNQFGVTLDIPWHLLDPKTPLRAAPRTPEQLGAIELPAEALTRLVGTYTLDAPPNLRLTVTVENRQLFVEAAGVGKLLFYARTPSNFFNTSLNAEITFVNDASGAVSGVVVTLGGVDQRGTKID
jgi:CubicO group peptidase (beta-lactamase class C family)